MIAAIAPIVIALLSLIIRLINLSTPKGMVFDEVYYVDGARDLLKYGVEVTGSAPEFIVHPPIGKWCIALGIKLFGDHEFGWRIVGAILGTAMILLIALIAHRLFYSPLLTALASALMAIDGMLLVHSRTALLDIFLAFFILTATYFWVVRKYWLTGLFLGLAIGTKWSALYFLALFGAIALYRTFTHHTGKTLIAPTLKRFVQFGVLPLSVYLASWSGWFLSKHGWDRQWSPSALNSLWHYHAQMWDFHTNLVTKHSYQANPWNWLIMGRPTSFFYESPKGCGAKLCAQEVLAMGTPLLWWIGTIAIALVFSLWFRSVVVSRFDPALNIVVIGMVAGYLPWFFFQRRTTFTFYAIIFEPFLILAIVYCAKMALDTSRGNILARSAITLVFIALLANFIYFLPIFTGQIISYEAWQNRMWFPSWI